jgi:PAS domain S-box-containing protein
MKKHKQNNDKLKVQGKKKASSPELKTKNSRLRNRAENKLREETAEKQGISLRDVHPLIHELQVHQVELEMQNEELRKAQIELEESRRKYSDLYDFAPVGYFTFDKTGLITEVNLTGAGQLGVERNLLINKPFSGFVHKDEQDIFYLHCKKAFETMSLQACEIRLKRKDGSWFYAQLQSRALEDRDVKTASCRTMVSDISTQRQAQEALQLSEKRYRSLFENLLDGFAYCKMLFDDQGRPVDFVYIEVNSIFGRLTGLESVVGRRVSEIIPGIRKRHPELFEIYGRVALTGQSEKFEMEFKPFKRWFSISVHSVEKEYFIAVFDDITERRLIEDALYRAHDELEIRILERTEELRESNELLENVFSNVHVLIAYMDTDFNFIRVNSKYAESGGKEPEFYAGKNYFDLFPDEEHKVIFRKVVETGEPYFAKAEPRAYEGHPEPRMKFWDLSLKPVKSSSGKISGLVLSLIDVTDNITLYSELMRSEHLASVGKLAAGVAHEINNPINGIINYAQMLLNKSEEASKSHDLASRIIKESDRIAGIVTSLLSFARESGEGKKPVHLRDILTDSLSLTDAQTSKSRIAIETDFPPNLPQIIAQPQHIEQVFLNLIINACHALNRKYTEAHKDKVLRIFAETVTVHNNPYVKVTFYDQGSGIPAGVLDKIMDPFFTTKKNEGTGLGLSISHGIITDHSGRIMIDSVEGEFTKVVIELPAHPIRPL